MISNRTKCLPAIMGLCFLLSSARAHTNHTTGTTAYTDSLHKSESLFDVKSPMLSDYHFTWGAEVGASIDLDGYDMSTFDLDVVIGYKNRLFKTAGLSVGFHRDFYKGNMLIPITAVVRTSFSSRPTWWFWALKAGYSFNSIGDVGTHGGFIFNTGIGFNLLRTKSLNCHLLLTYQFLHLSGEQQVMVDKLRNHIDMAQIGFGVNF